MAEMTKIMKDAKKNYILAMNAAHEHIRDQGSLSDYDIRRKLVSDVRKGLVRDL